MKEEFFTADTLKEICRRLVNHYFLLTPAELEMWDSDPENGSYRYIVVFNKFIMNWF